MIGEDSVLLRAGLTRLVEDAGHTVAAAVGDGPALVRAITGERPDLSIVDVRMPPTFTDEGLSVANRIRAREPDARFLVLTQHVRHRSAVELLSSGRGGIGYLLKERVGEVSEFLDAIDRIAAGGSVIDPEVVRRVFAGQRRCTELSRLTPREREVLARMAEGMTNPAIAGALMVSEATVAKHVNGIFAKFDLSRSLTDDRRVHAVLTYLSAVDEYR